MEAMRPLEGLRMACPPPLRCVTRTKGPPGDDGSKVGEGGKAKRGLGIAGKGKGGNKKAFRDIVRSDPTSYGEEALK